MKKLGLILWLRTQLNQNFVVGLNIMCLKPSLTSFDLYLNWIMKNKLHSPVWKEDLWF